MKLSNRLLLNSINVLTKLNQLELPIKVAFIKDECVGKWNSDINELLDLEVSIDLQTISIDDLFRADLSMTPTELSSIEFMIKD